MTLLLAALLATQPDTTFTKWEKEIAALEKKNASVKPGGIVFVGSSTIRLWDLKKSFPDWNAVNCGFGGSEIRHSTYFAKRIVAPLKPEKIVFYGGDNDLAAKRTPQQVRDDFAAFVKEIHEQLPKVKIYWMPIKPSVKRWAIYDQQKEANKLVKEIIEKDPLLVYVDLVALHLDSNGKPDPKYFVADGLHLSEAGYAKWNDVLKKELK